MKDFFTEVDCDILSVEKISPGRYGWSGGTQPTKGMSLKKANALIRERSRRVQR